MVLSPLQKALQHMQESFDDAILHMNGVSSGTGEKGVCVAAVETSHLIDTTSHSSMFL